MKTKLKELKEQRMKIISDQRAIVDLSDKEKRSFTEDENVKYENLNKDFDKLTDEIKGVEDEIEKRNKEAFRKKELEERERLLRNPDDHISPDVDLDNKDKRDKKEDPKYMEYSVRKKYEDVRKLFRSTSGHRSTPDYHRASEVFFVHGEKEARALQVDLDVSGGYLVAPEQMVFQVIEALDDNVFVRQYANVMSLPNAVSLGAPTRENDMSDIEWTGEISSAGEDSTLDFGKRSIYPHPLAKLIKASKTLIRMGQIDVAGYIATAFARKMGYVEENAFLNGDGIDKPLGVFTSTDAGIDSTRDVSAGNTGTAMTADGLHNCVMNLRLQYRRRPGFRWCFHRDGIKMIRKLKDGDGQYIWRPGLTEREPDRILGYPYDESEYAPNTFSSGKLVGILGDWSYYWIADALNMEIQVLLELYARTNQNGYICRKSTDGAPVLPDAFSRVKLS